MVEVQKFRRNLLNLLRNDFGEFTIFCRNKKKVDDNINEFKNENLILNIVEIDLLNMEINYIFIEKIKNKISGIIWVSGVTGDPENEIAEIILLLFPREPKESTMQFHYMIKRTHDPQIRFSKAVQWLSSSFYQHPEEFGVVLTALFTKDSNLFKKIKIKKECILVFDYQQQRFKFACVVNEVSRDTPEYQFTFWHNKLFNSLLPTNARVLAFHPDWENLEASPEVSLTN